MNIVGELAAYLETVSERESDVIMGEIATLMKSGPEVHDSNVYLEYLMMIHSGGRFPRKERKWNL